MPINERYYGQSSCEACECKQEEEGMLEPNLYSFLSGQWIIQKYNMP